MDSVDLCRKLTPAMSGPLVKLLVYDPQFLFHTGTDDAVRVWETRIQF